MAKQYFIAGTDKPALSGTRQRPTNNADANIEQLGKVLELIAAELSSLGRKVDVLVAAEETRKRDAVAAELGAVVANQLKGRALDAAFTKLPTIKKTDEFDGYSLNGH